MCAYQTKAQKPLPLLRTVVLSCLSNDCRQKWIFQIKPNQRLTCVAWRRLQKPHAPHTMIDCSFHHNIDKESLNERMTTSQSFSMYLPSPNKRRVLCAANHLGIRWMRDDQNTKVWQFFPSIAIFCCCKFHTCFWRLLTGECRHSLLSLDIAFEKWLNWTGRTSIFH